MHARRAYALMLVALVAATVAGAGHAKRTPLTLRVMTRNLYLGANLDAIVQAKSLPEALTAVARGWEQVQANDFPTRARAIAREIAAARPDFVGFQEATLYRTQSPPASTQATAVALDYVRELLGALAARKLKYRFVRVAPWTDAQLPAGYPATMDIRITVRDALLVRVDPKLKIRRVRQKQYDQTTPLFGGFITAKRGYVYADATMNGRSFRVVTTHLESFSDASQVTQGQELADTFGRGGVPTVLLGDLNSRADRTGTPTIATLLGAGFKDAWPQAHPNDVGLTCCHGDDLRQVGGPFYSRIDYVLMRNGFRAVAAGIVGRAASERIDGLWPSDHAGVWARLRLP
ncbi:MAG: endonuclease/exonuclease/phosphatase family protein [Gaiellaceae bacterium]